MRLRAAATALPFLAALVPPIIVARSIVRYGVDVPVWDQWAFAPLVGDAFEGTLDWSRIWAQHNEHRVVLPRLLLLGLASLSRWDVRWELATNFVLAAATLLLLVALLRATVGRSQPDAVPWLVLVASCLTFSPAQSENWMWGWQVGIFLETAIVTGIAVVLSRWRGGWPGLVLVVVLGWAGALSFASGLVLLVLVPAAVLVHPVLRPWRRRLAQTAVALLLGMGLLALYLYGYRRPPHHPAPLQVLDVPRAYGEYVLAYVGSSLGLYDVWIAIYWGVVGIALLAAGGGWLVARGCWPILAPWAFLAAHALGSGAITAVGRGGFGALQALVPRYVTISAPLWLCVAVVIAMVLGRLVARGEGAERARLAAVALTAVLTTLAVQGWHRTWMAGEQAMAELHRANARNRECLASFERAPASCVAKVFSSKLLLEREVPRLRRLGLSVFRPSAQEPALSAYAVVGAMGGWIGRAGVSRSHPDEVVVTGWAQDPSDNRPARAVLVTADGVVLGRASVGGHRPDVVQATGLRSLRQSGWRFRFASYRLPPGTHRIDAFAIVGDGTALVRLAGATDVSIGR